MTTIPISGTVVTTALVNIRQGAPSTHAPILRKVQPGTTLSVQAVAAGESVHGNPHWYQLAGGAYVWAGGCSELGGASAPRTNVDTVVEVVDLYHKDRVTSFAQARAAGVIGIIHKATTGATGHDPEYAGRRELAKAAGLLWGAYHWGTHTPVEDQVKNFLDTAQPDRDTLVALDFERDSSQMELDQARAFLEAIEDTLGRKAVLYSGEVAKSKLGHTVDRYFGSHRLWLCQYGPKPKVQESWDSYWLWQYTDGKDGPGPRTVAGIPGDDQNHLDCNHYQGSEAKLRAEWAS